MASRNETWRGSSRKIISNATTRPGPMISICCTSVQVTVRMPPVTVYSTTVTPMINVVRRSGQPKIMESTMAGANLARQQPEDHQQRHHQAEEDDQHLLHIGPGDRANAAGHRVQHYRDADDQRGQADRKS